MQKAERQEGKPVALFVNFDWREKGMFLPKS